MKLSKNNRQLIKVAPKDIVDGSFIIPSGVTHIGREAFMNCTNLIQVIIPNSVTYIGFSALEGCRRLRSIIMHCKYAPPLDTLYYQVANEQMKELPLPKSSEEFEGFKRKADAIMKHYEALCTERKKRSNKTENIHQAQLNS